MDAHLSIMRLYDRPGIQVGCRNSKQGIVALFNGKSDMQAVPFGSDVRPINVGGHHLSDCGSSWLIEGANTNDHV